MAEQRSEIAFFDVETTVPTRSGQGFTMLEFGAILVCPKKLVELENYSTLICPKDLYLINYISDRWNGITRAAVSSAPPFWFVADKIFDLLNGRIWAGHNILRFDCPRIREAFAEIGRSPPEPKGIIDSLALLTERFGRRAGNMKMATLATYFEMGPQTHRSLDDVRMNLEVVKCCATVLFLETSRLLTISEGCSSSSTFLTPDDVIITSIGASLVPFYRGSRRIQILHGTTLLSLKLHCTKLKVRFGISKKFVDQAGRPRLSFVVDAPQSTCQVLEASDIHAQRLFTESGSTSDWRPVVARKYGYWNFPTIRLHIPTVVTGDIARYGTEIFQREASSGGEQKLVFSRFDPAELESLFTAGSFIDAFFSLDTYDYQQSAGIRLVTEKLVIHSK